MVVDGLMLVIFVGVFHVSHTDLSLGRFVSYLGKLHFCNVPEGNTLLTSYFVQKCANVFYLRDSH
jgi:hypothetical protein